MKKICVLSTNNNPGYHFYVPIVEWAWNKFGWEIALFKTSDVGDVGVRSETTKEYVIPDTPSVRTNTLAQTVRHFTADVLPNDAYIMVQDIDLIPLKNWWNPDLNARTILGWETTGHSFIPVHYTGMSGDKWYDLMDCTGNMAADMEREFKCNGRAYGEKWEQYWDTDWAILTEKVLPKKDQFVFVERGFAHCGRHTVPKGRVDRSSIEVLSDGSYSWGETLEQPELLDAHCENHNSSSPAKWKNIRALLEKCFGELPEWMDEHAKTHFEKHGIK